MINVGNKKGLQPVSNHTDFSHAHCCSIDRFARRRLLIQSLRPMAAGLLLNSPCSSILSAIIQVTVLNAYVYKEHVLGAR